MANNNNFNSLEINTDDFVFSFSDEFSATTIQKLQSALSDDGAGFGKLKMYAANVLIGNLPAKKVNESVGVKFTLCGFHAKPFTFAKSGNKGIYTTMFGKEKNGDPCAYCSSSDKIYEAILKILFIYGDASNWNGGIDVKIKMNMLDEGNRAYSLEVMEYEV